MIRDRSSQFDVRLALPKAQRISGSRAPLLGWKTASSRSVSAPRNIRSPARLRRELQRNFPGWTVVRLTTSLDPEHSFGPACLRGWLRHGQRTLAVVGVNHEETQSTIDGALTSGILWLEACRLAQHERHVVEGLVLVVPEGTEALQRMAHLHRRRRNGIDTNSTNAKRHSRRWTLAMAAIRQPGWCIPPTKGGCASVGRNRLRAFAAFAAIAGRGAVAVESFRGPMIFLPARSGRRSRRRDEIRVLFGKKSSRAAVRAA